MKNFWWFVSGMALAFVVVHGAECHAEDNWTKANTKWELGFIALATADMFQTMDIKNHDNIEEGNPVAAMILGDNPEKLPTVGYFAGAMLGHYVVSRVLPPNARELWQGGTIIIQGGVVANNWALGLRFNY